MKQYDSARPTSLIKGLISLNAANAFNYAVTLLLPIVLTRILFPEQYGQYRLVWLWANTAVGLGTLYLPQSLFYFLPRAAQKEKPVYVLATLLFLSLAGFLATWILCGSIPAVLGEKTVPPEVLAPAAMFSGIWLASSLIESLPAASNLIRKQAAILIFLALTRVAAVLGAAYFGRDVSSVRMALLIFATIRWLYLISFCIRHYACDSLPSGWSRMVAIQFRYALPFGVGSGLFNARAQAEHWIAALQFSIREYAAFSIGGYLGPLFTLLRQTSNTAILPRMSTLHAEGRCEDMLEIFRASNGIMSSGVFYLGGLLCLLSPSLVTVIFTESYIDAATVMRVYLIGVAWQALDVNNLMRVYNLGRHVASVNGFLLVISIAASAFGGAFLGLPGIALGSVSTIVLGQIINIKKVIFVTKRPLSTLFNFRLLFIQAASTIVAGLMVFTSGDFIPKTSPGLLEMMRTGLLYSFVWFAIFVVTGAARMSLAQIKYLSRI
jgi:O-antigen/teichoic acid export membrane protein